MKLREQLYKLMYLFKRRGQKEYCVNCLPSKGYAYWLMDKRYSRIKPVDQCMHK